MLYVKGQSVVYFLVIKQLLMIVFGSMMMQYTDINDCIKSL